MLQYIIIIIKDIILIINNIILSVIRGSISY